MHRSLGSPPLLPRPRPHISELPVEIRDVILEHVSSEQRKPYTQVDAALAALARTSRQFYDCAMPLLYRDVVRKHPLLVYWAAQHGREGTMKRLFAAGETLMQSVRFDWRTPRWSMLVPDDHIPPECSYWPPGRLYRNMSLGGVVCPGPTCPHVHMAQLQCRGHASPVHFAVVAGHVELLELMIDRCPGIVRQESRSLQFGGDGTPLHLALDCPSRLTGKQVLRIVQLLLRAGSDTRIKCGDLGMDRDSALHIACRLGRKDIVRLLLDQEPEASVNFVNHKGVSPIWEAIFRDQWPVIDLLLQHGVSIDSVSDHGYTPLIAACIQGKWKRAMRLVRCGADVNAQCKIDQRRGDYDSCPLPQVLPGQWTPSHGLFGRRPIDICCHRGVSEHEHELDTYDSVDGSSRSTHPSRSNRQDLVAMLIERGADLGPDGSNSQRPPLVVAAASHLGGIVAALIRAGAAVNLADAHGISPLAAATCFGVGCPVSIENYHPVRYVTDFSLTALLFSSHSMEPDEDLGSKHCSGLECCVKQLLEHGADVNLVNQYGDTPWSLLTVERKIRWRVFRDEGAWYMMTNVGFWGTKLAPQQKARMVGLYLKHGADPLAPLDATFGDGGDDLTKLSWSAAQHLFFSGEFPSCRLVFNEQGRNFRPIPDAQIQWMYEWAWQVGVRDGRDSPRFAFALQFLEESFGRSHLVPETPHPSALLWPLRFAKMDVARTIWDLGVPADLFKEERCLEHLGSVFGSEPVQLGSAVLELAVLARDFRLVTQVIGLAKGLKVRPQAVLLALHDQQRLILDRLIAHGAPAHVPDESMKLDGRPVKQHADPSISRWRDHMVAYRKAGTVGNCKNPLKLAIRHASEDKEMAGCLEILLNRSTDTMTPECRSLYLQEASRRLLPTVLRSLLQHPAIRAMRDAELRDGIDVYKELLIDLLYYVDRVCLLFCKQQKANRRVCPQHKESPTEEGDDWLWGSGAPCTCLHKGRKLPGNEQRLRCRDPELVQQSIDRWVYCLGIIAGEGVDPNSRALPDGPELGTRRRPPRGSHAGMSILDYLDRSALYSGNHWFRTRLANTLRLYGDRGRSEFNVTDCFEAIIERSCGR